MKKYTTVLFLLIGFTICTAQKATKTTTTEKKKLSASATFVAPSNTPNNSGLNFDSIIKNMSSAVNPDLIHGYWKYAHTLEFKNDGTQSEYGRFYYDSEEMSKQKAANQSTEIDPIKMKEQERESAFKMGRSTISQTDLIMPYDPNVNYFFWNQGNGKQLFVIQQIKGKEVTYLNPMETNYAVTKNEKSGKYSLILNCPSTGIHKDFVVLSITDDQMVIADVAFREIQYFNKTTR